MELEGNLTQYQGMVQGKDNELRAITLRLQLEEEEKGLLMVLRNSFNLILLEVCGLRTVLVALYIIF